jgi:diguanylate cyclase (GGDEF)-like protein
MQHRLCVLRSLFRGTRTVDLTTNLRLVPAAALQRRLLFATAVLLFAAVFMSFIVFEVSGLGVGHFFYIPIALLALAGGTRLGFLGGVAAAGLYALAILITPRLPTRDVLTAATAIRLVTYSSCGALVGWFANEHRRHLAQLRVLADRDFLTGIFNTRVFDEALARRCHSGQPFLLLLGDMDNLKQVNDTHGHAAGNTELRRLADVLTRLLGTEDELARVGGDEFAILTDGSVSEAAARCVHLHDSLAAENLQMTFGWAALPEDGAGPLELFRKADDRLYAAKLIARNHRVVANLAAARQ